MGIRLKAQGLSPLLWTLKTTSLSVWSQLLLKCSPAANLTNRLGIVFLNLPLLIPQNVRNSFGQHRTKRCNVNKVILLPRKMALPTVLARVSPRLTSRLLNPGYSTFGALNNLKLLLTPSYRRFPAILGWPLARV